MNYLEKRLAAGNRRQATVNHPAPPVIDRHIPPPLEYRGGERWFDHFYPFEQMLPGDSFWVSSDTGCTPGAVTKFARRTGWKFMTRAQSRDGVPNGKVSRRERGTRVWRIA